MKCHITPYSASRRISSWSKWVCGKYLTSATAFMDSLPRVVVQLPPKKPDPRRHCGKQSGQVPSNFDQTVSTVRPSICEVCEEQPSESNAVSDHIVRYKYRHRA